MVNARASATAAARQLPEAPIIAWHRCYRRLLVACLLLTFCVVGLGAYVRLSDAGLGCPDWPGCYGHLVGVPVAPQEQAMAAAAFPGKPLVVAKAWKEMIHRYLAGTLGLLVLALAITAWRRRARRDAMPWLATSLVALVGFQAALGMWTVTLLLKPVIVTAHLLGGMGTWAILVLLGWREFGRERTPNPGAEPPSTSSRPLATLATLAVFAQIALGGWVSSNYAALACPDFPTCRGLWLPPADFTHGFTLLRELGETASGALLPGDALTAIHLTHRAGAVVVALLAGGLGLRLLGQRGYRRFGAFLLGALVLQIGLGVGNILAQLPLPLAVAHNLGAAVLLAAALSARYALGIGAANPGS